MPPRPHHITTCLLVALAVLLGASPVAAAAPSKRAAERSRPAAEQALKRVERLAAGRGVRTGRELTTALRELAARLDALAPAERREAGRLLARPTDGAADPDGYTLPEGTPHCTPNFCVHYVTGGSDAPSLSSADGDGIPDYVQDMAEEFEFAHARETGPPPGGLGWQEPVSDGARGEQAGSGATGRTDIYLKELAGRGILGYAATDAGQPGATQYAYVVMDDDYTDVGAGTPLHLLQSTVAHEYNHVLQYSYDVHGDAWMYESTAVWMEDHVHDGLDTWLGFLAPPNGWVTTPEIPITLEQSPRMYGSGVWNHWLSEQYGDDAVRGVWERSRTATPASFAPAAYEGSILAEGGAGFSDEFARFAAATAEWRAPGSGFSEGASFPDVERLGGISVGDFPATVELDHTTFGLLDVTPSAAGAVRLNVAAPQDTVTGIALVGRTGSSPTAGTLATRFRLLPSGGSGSVELASPGGYGRITAVVVNADPSQSGFGATDWNYTKDDTSFDVELEALLSPSAPPANTALPAVAGTATDSGTLTATDGSWSGSAPFTFTRQWRRCDAAGANCSNITGATGASYSPVGDDIGKRLRVRVTATNSADTATAESAPSGVVQASAPSNTALPEISGAAAEGQVLTATNGTWKGTPTISFTRQWLRCDAAGANCVNIGGATGSTYTLASADVAKRIRVQVSASNTQGTGPAATSAATPLVSGTAPLDDNPPTITGTPRPGETLTAGNGTWTGTVPMTFARQWMRCDADGLDCVDVGGATGDTYLLSATDLGHRIRVRVTATNAAGSRAALSAARGPVVPAPPANSTLPVVGSPSPPRDGDVVTVATGTWTGDGPLTFSHQWLRCNAPAGDGCTEIAGATGTSYTLTPADVGKRLRVRETAANAGGPGAPVQSAATAAVAARAPSNLTSPTIGGSPQAGQTLTGSDGSWGGTAPVALTRRWLRCNAAGAACAAIAFATVSTYVPVAADVGSTLRLEVTATNAGGSAIALSSATAPVTAAPAGGGTGGGGTGGGGSGGGGSGDDGGGGGTGGGGSGGGSDPVPLSAEFGIGRSFKLAAVRTRGLRFKLECNTACSVRAELLIPRKVAKRLGIAAAAQVRIGSGRATLAAGGSRTVLVKLTKKAARRLRRTRALDATLRIVVADGGGTASSPLITRVKLGR